MIPVYKKSNPLTTGLEFLKDPLSFMLKNGPVYGDLYRVWLPLRRLYVTTDPEVIRHVLQTHHRNYVKSPAYRNLKLALGNGLVTSEGDFWFKQRRLAQPAFYKAALAGIFEKMADVAEDFCKNLEQERGATIELAQKMMEVTSDIVLKALFSVSNDRDKQQMYRQIIGAQEYIMDRTTHPFRIPLYYLNGRHRQFLKYRRDFDEMAYRFIDEHKKNPDPPADFLTLLLQTKDADTGEGMSDLQIRDEAITIFAAGHETSANALSWTIYLLSQHPDIARKVREEAENVFGDKKPEFADIQKLSYAKQVIEESMRLYPPAYAVGREAAIDDEILGEPIPKKSIVFIGIHALHHSEKYWPNPEKFDPERFTPEKAKDRPKFAYMPFGLGPRMCIGEHFAMMEMQLLLALLIQKFDFQYAGKEAPGYITLVTLKPENGMPMRVG